MRRDELRKAVSLLVRVGGQCLAIAEWLLFSSWRIVARNIWLVVALLILGLAAWLASETVTLKPGEASDEAQLREPRITFFLVAPRINSKSAFRKEPIASLVGEGASLSLDFTVIGDFNLIAIGLTWLDETRGCVIGENRNVQLPFEKVGNELSSPLYRIEILYTGAISFGQIRCFLQPTPIRTEGYAARSARFSIVTSPFETSWENNSNIPRAFGRVDRKVPLDPMRATELGFAPASYIVDFSTMRGTKNVVFHTGAPVERENEKRRRISLERLEHDAFAIEDIRVSWDDEAALYRRDLWLLVIGVLLGFSGAAFIEWMRPAIEKLRKSEFPGLRRR